MALRVRAVGCHGLHRRLAISRRALVPHSPVLAILFIALLPNEASKAMVAAAAWGRAVDVVLVEVEQSGTRGPGP